MRDRHRWFQTGQSPMPTIDIDGQALYYDWRDKAAPVGAPALVLLNSLGADLSMWDAQIDTFAERFRVLRFDARGHGRSALAPSAFDIAAMGRDALALMDALSIERAHICGLSMGGQIAQWLGIHAAARVAALVICNSAAQIGSAQTWDARISAVKAGGMAAVIDPVLARWFTPRFRAAAPDVVAAMRSMILATPPEGYVAACGAVRDADFRADVGRITAPTLVIASTHDESTPARDGRLLASTISGARYVELDSAHLSNIEQAARFTEAVLEFLKGGH
jgi:3-oxoadipate enol-lactonase